MAKANSTSETATTQARRYTVGYIRDQRKFNPSPSITLKGHWMTEFGFNTGQKIEVITQQGQLLIRLANEG